MAGLSVNVPHQPPFAPATTLTVTGGTLFAVAAEQWGDFTGFWLLLQANGLSDPWLQGVNTITVPDYSAALTGGVPPQQ